MTLEEFLEKFDNAVPRGNGYDVFCPAHDDNNHESLSVSEGDDGKLLLQCRAGCSTESVLEAMGLAFRDLFNDNVNHAEPEAIYSYEDEEGEELFQAVRFPGKKFRQRHRTPNNDPSAVIGEERPWVWNLDGVRRVLFRLPELLAGVSGGATVYIVEGEKDVLALMNRGKIATCNPMGAGKWRPEYAEFLRGAAQVIIIADRDEPGRAHAELVKTSLQGLVESLWIYQAKRGKDVSDHLAAGLELSQLAPLRNRVRRGILTARELAEGAMEDLELTSSDIPGYVLVDAVPVTFRPGRMYAVGAYTGDGKTRYGLQGARTLCIAGVRVGYVSLEMPERDLRNGLVAHRGIPLRILEEPWRIRADAELQARYREYIEEIAGWNLDIVFDSGMTADKIVELARDREWEAVIVDHIHRFGWGRERRTLESEVLKLTNLALEQNVMVLLLCQLRKHQRGQNFEAYPMPTLQDFRETSQIADDASMALSIWRQRDSGGIGYTGATQVMILKNRHTTARNDQAGHVILPNFDTERQVFTTAPVPERSF